MGRMKEIWQEDREAKVRDLMRYTPGMTEEEAYDVLFGHEDRDPS